LTWQRISPILISICVLVFVNVMGQRNRTVAGMASAMPVTLPLAMWVYYRTSGTGYPGLTQFVGAQMRAIVATVAFVVVCYVTISHRWPFLAAIAAGYGTWFTIVVGEPWAWRAVQWAIQVFPH
jgi:hypothetical protein